MQANHLSRFTKRIPVNTGMESLYLAWATQVGLEAWFLRSAEFALPDGTPRPRNSQIQQGDHYQWRWHGYNDTAAESGTILAANGIDFISFTFSDSIVSVTLKVEDGENIVELVQHDIPLAGDVTKSLFIACGEGWTFYLANLKSICQGGIDLRNKNLNIKRVISS